MSALSRRSADLKRDDDNDRPFHRSTMTSYLSSLLWGTSQLDDAVGMLISSS